MGRNTRSYYWCSIQTTVPNLLNREFLDLSEETLYTIHLSKKKCLIMSDVNINTLNKSNIAKEYLNLVRSEGFNPF